MTERRPRHEKASPEPETAGRLLAHLEKTMSQWMEMQRDQQRLNERFLALQERIVSALLSGDVGGLDLVSVESTLSAAEPGSLKAMCPFDPIPSNCKSMPPAA